MVGLILLTYYGWRWLILPVFCWLIGHGILVWLTQWNQHFDDMFFAQVNRKYKARYSAG